ncbi:MAG: hypothetical protein VKI82_11670 [Leptolyngbya sp.]|nr:hypothetical protein [Leptolyngbya sp.]
MTQAGAPPFSLSSTLGGCANCGTGVAIIETISPVQRRQAPTGLGDKATHRAVAARIAQRITDDLRLGIFDRILERYAVPNATQPPARRGWRGVPVH